MDMHSPENPAQDGNMLGIGDWIKLFDSNNKCQLFMAIMTVLISLDKSLSGAFDETGVPGARHFSEVCALVRFVNRAITFTLFQ
jgi:hypothetical protein